MANLYVRSTDGSDADNGSTWALAKATLTGAAAIDAAGDSIYLSQAHAESTNAAISFVLAGTLASPTKVVCGNDAAEPPTSTSTAASISTGAGAYPISLSGNCHVHGVSFNAGVGSASNIQILLAITGSGEYQSFSNCHFGIGSSATSATGTCVRFGNTGSNAAPSIVELKNCTVGFAATQSNVQPENTNLIWSGGGIKVGTAAITLFLSPQETRTGRILLEGLDLSAGAAGMNLVNPANLSPRTEIVFRNCKLPASWSGSLASSAVPLIGTKLALYNCDSSDTNYRLWTVDYFGSVVSETTIVRSSGASDGTTPISWRLTSLANAEYPHQCLKSPEIVRWNDTTGSAITVTVEVVTDNVTLTDAECWLDVQYLGTSGYPLGAFVSDAKADVLATAANQSTSSVTWTTTGLGTPVKQKLSVTFTPQENGFIHAVVKLAKASTTVYVDPLLTVT